MRLRFLLLAQYAFAHDDGRMYVTGGGIEVLEVPSVPAVEHQLSLAVGVAFSPAECNRDHILEIRSFTPRELELLPSRKFPVKPLSDSRYPGADVQFQFVLNMRDVPFLETGTYRFVLIHDGRDCASAHLSIRAVPSTGEGVAAAMELHQGYEAFRRGDTDRAQQIFAAVVAKLPLEPAAHNNLAFTYLAKRQPEEALAGFRRAGELGYEHRDLLDFNVACCNYLLSRFAESLAGFQYCLRSYAYMGTGTLFGIADGTLFPARLSGPGDYFALASLNAAWSAWQVGDNLRATAFVGAVQSTTAGEGPATELAATPAFGRSIAALRAKLATPQE